MAQPTDPGPEAGREVRRAYETGGEGRVGHGHSDCEVARANDRTVPLRCPPKQAAIRCGHGIFFILLLCPLLTPRIIFLSSNIHRMHVGFLPDINAVENSNKRLGKFCLRIDNFYRTCGCDLAVNEAITF